MSPTDLNLLQGEELRLVELEAELDALARSLDDDERYSPAQFARLLANLR